MEGSTRIPSQRGEKGGSVHIFPPCKGGQEARFSRPSHAWQQLRAVLRDTWVPPSPACCAHLRESCCTVREWCHRFLGSRKKWINVWSNQLLLMSADQIMHLKKDFAYKINLCPLKSRFSAKLVQCRPPMWPPQDQTKVAIISGWPYPK